jgi:quinoprotein glucose dehydrogenase
VLADQLDLLLAGKLPAPLALDLLEAAALRTDAAVKQKLAAYEASRAASDSLAKWRECMEGGDAKEGRAIFAEKAEAGCNRCHKVKGEGGDVGPDLAGATVKRDRPHLLQSIVEPSSEITPGYENVLITLKNGEMIAGLLSAEDANEVTLASLIDGKKQKLKKADIQQRTSVPSAMPPGLGEVLGKRGLRDVIEYLATLK